MSSATVPSEYARWTFPSPLATESHQSGFCARSALQSGKAATQEASVGRPTEALAAAERALAIEPSNSRAQRAAAKLRTPGVS